MRILFFHRWVGVHSGGTETHVLELAKRFAARGHMVEILTREGPALGDLDPRIKAHRISANVGESLHSYDMNDLRLYIYLVMFGVKALAFFFAAALKGQRYDVVSVHFTTEAFLMQIVRAVLGWPYVFVLEGYTDMEAKQAKHADCATAISRFIVENCERKVGFSPIYIPVGVDTRRFSPGRDDEIRRRWAKDGEVLVVCVARLEPRKDLSTLVKAAKIISEKRRDVRVLLVGDGIQRDELKEMVRSLGLKERVMFAGAVSDEDLPRHYHAADLFVLPTVVEGFGIVFLEAMASGLPIVSTTLEVVQEVTAGHAKLAPMHDPEGFARVLLEALSDKEWQTRERKEGPAYAAKFDWEGLVTEYEKAYMGVVGRRR